MENGTTISDKGVHNVMIMHSPSVTEAVVDSLSKEGLTKYNEAGKMPAVNGITTKDNQNILYGQISQLNNGFGSLSGVGNNCLIGGWDYSWPHGTFSYQTPYRLKEDGNFTEISHDVPGIKPKDLKVEFIGDQLRVSGVRYDTKASVGYNMPLNGKYKTKTAKATIVDGVLIIRVQRVKEDYRKVEVEVK